MAEGQEFAQVFQNLTAELTNVSSALTTQGIAANIPKFDGNPKFYRDWVRAIDKYAIYYMFRMTERHFWHFYPLVGQLADLLNGT